MLSAATSHATGILSKCILRDTVAPERVALGGPVHSLT